MSKRKQDIQAPENPDNRRRRSDQLRKPNLRQPSLPENDRAASTLPPQSASPDTATFKQDVEQRTSTLQSESSDVSTSPAPGIRRIRDHLSQHRSEGSDTPEQKIEKTSQPSHVETSAPSPNVKSVRSTPAQEQHVDLPKEATHESAGRKTDLSGNTYDNSRHSVMRSASATDRRQARHTSSNARSRGIQRSIHDDGHTRHVTSHALPEDMHDYIRDDGHTRRAPSYDQAGDIHDYIRDDGYTRHASTYAGDHNIENITAAEQLQEELENLLDDRKFKAYKRDLRKRVSGKPTRSSSVISVPSALLSGVKKTFFAVFIIFLVVIFFFLSCGFGIMSGYLATAKPFEITDIKKTYDATYVYDRNGDISAVLTGSQNMLREYVPYAEFHETYIDDAFIAIEDERFETHSGIDPKRIASAMGNLLLNFGGGTPSHGGSTITQQVVKMMSGADERSAQRKIQEWERAIMLEKRLSKEKIIELFVNLVPMSNHYVGVQAASKAYFGKNVSELDLAECAFLAGIPNLPSIYNPWTEHGKRNALRRMRSTLSKMLELGKINQAEYETAINRELVILKPQDTDTTSEIHSYFVEAVIEQVRSELITKRGYSPTLADIAIFQQGLHIETTMNPMIQKMAESTFQKKELMMTNYTAMPDMPQKPQASITVISNLPETRGQVVALVGGFGEKKDNFGFNRATQAYRQPGSSIKPILDYGPAMDLGIITAGTVLIDEPKFYDPHNPDVAWPNNSGNVYRGPITVRQAIRQSVNTVAVEVYEKMLTPQLGLSYLKRLGIDRTTETQPAGALGAFGHGVTSMELAGAYTALANNGLFTEPYLFTRVLDADGKILLEYTPSFEQVFREETADIVTDILVDTLEHASWIAPYARLDPQQAAGKTGTSDERNDRLFAGYTPYYTAAVWYGYDNAHGRWTDIPEEDTKMPIVIWKDVMAQIHETLPPISFDMSPNIVRQTICSQSGLIATKWCPKKYTELFDMTNKSAPKIVCPLHAEPRETEPPIESDPSMPEGPIIVEPDPPHSEPAPSASD